MFEHLKDKDKVKLVFDCRVPDVDEACFEHDVDWVPFHGKLEEELPSRMPTPHGCAVGIHCFC